MIVKLLVDGGNMKPGPAIAQKLGPLGINIGKIIQEVNSATKSFNGMKVPVILDIDTKTKEFKIEIQTPPVAELIKKEVGIEKGSGEPDKIKVANLAIEQIIAITKTKAPNMLVNSFKSAVKNVVSSCISLGILIENKSPKFILRQIDKGKYDDEIEKQKTTVSEEKKASIKEFFDNVLEEQEIRKKAKEAEEAAEAEAAEAAGKEGEAEKEEKAEEKEGEQKPEAAEEKKEERKL